MTGDLSFPRRFRLSSREDFRRLFRKGKRLRGRFVRGILLQEKDFVPCKWGIVVGRKFGGAVLRNRAKRIARRAIRERLQEFPSGFAMVVEILPEAKSLSKTELYRAVDESIESCLKKIQG